MVIATKKPADSYYSALFISLLFCTFYTAPLFSYCPIRFSDIGCMIILYISLRLNPRIQSTTNAKCALFLIFWAILDGFLLLRNPTFSITNHITQLIRFIFALFTFCYLPNLLRQLEAKKVFIVIRNLILVHVTVQIIYFILYYIGFSSLFNIIADFDGRLALISHNNLFFNHFIIVNTFSGYARFSGFFEEPAWFGWNLNLMLAIVLQYQYCSHVKLLSNWNIFFIIVAFLLTFSFSAVFSLIIILLIYSVLINKLNLFNILILSILGFGLIIYLIYLLNDDFFQRLINIMDGSDGSSNSRIIGSWNSFITALYNDPILGYGLGDNNRIEYYNNLPTNKMHGIKIMGITIFDMHNMLLQIVGNLGILGGILFLYLLKGISLKNSSIVLFAVILTFFTVNVFNNYFYYIIIGIAIYYLSKKYHKKRI